MALCGAGVGCRRLRLLLWKNFLTQKRAKYFTVLEFGLPICLLVPLVFFASSGELRGDAKRYDPFVVHGTAEDYVTKIGGNGSIIGRCKKVPVAIAFSPNDSVVAQRIISATAARLKLNIIRGFAKEKHLIRFLRKENTVSEKCGRKYYGAVVFTKTWRDADKPYGEITYKIRLRHDLTPWGTFGLSSYSLKTIAAPRNPASPVGGPPDYWYSGFLTLQRAVDMSIVEEVLDARAPRLSVSLRRMPYPAWKESKVPALHGILPAFTCWCLFLLILEAANDIAEEKEKKIKIYMKTMGLTSRMYWLSYFTWNFLKSFVMCVIFTAVTLLIIPGTSVFVLLLVFLLYSAAAIWFAFFVTALFSTVNSAMLFITIAWSLLFVMVSALGTVFTNIIYKLLCCLNMNMAVSYAINLFSTQKLLWDGATLSTLFASTPEDSLTMAHVIGMLAFDTLLFMLLTCYMDAVSPGDGSQAQPLYFPFLKSYWFPNAGKNGVGAATTPETNDNGHTSEAPVTEMDTPGIEPSIVIHRLTKQFDQRDIFDLMFQGCGDSDKKPFKAVDNLSMNIYPHQITALLGHNGAGKTTTFSMLTGMLEATSGYATVDGLDTRFEMERIRQMFGLCPQHNALFVGLSVREHLKFYCELKGCEFEEHEMNYLLDSLSLMPKVHALSETLSGGMKRKLSMCIALIGGSKLVILDEPTSGMDPDGRHEAWQLLQELKLQRTMLLTTHYMEEADLLGDRIAIMADGRLRCDGTGLFLKNHYQIGFHLKVEFDTNNGNNLAEKADQVLLVLQRSCPTALLLTQDGVEAGYRLAIGDRDHFGDLFGELEDLKAGLGIQSFGMSVGTMDDVFLKVGELAEAEKAQNEAEEARRKKEARKGGGDHGNNDTDTPPTIENLVIAQPNTGFWLFLQQIFAVLIERYYFSIEEISILLSQLMVPIVNTVIAVNVATMLSQSGYSQWKLTVGMNHLTGTTIPLDDFGVTGIAQRFDTSYRSFASSGGVRLNQLEVPVDKFVLEEYLLKDGRRYVDSNYFVGAEIKTNNLNGNGYTVGFFNNQKMHTAAISLNLIDNALVQLSSKNVSITTINHPLPPTSLNHLNGPDPSAILVASFMLFIFGVVIADCVGIPAEETARKVRHLKLISGLSVWRYWLSSAIWDWTVCLLATTEVLVMMAANGADAYIVDGQWLATGATLLAYCWAALPFAYAMSFWFRSPTIATIIVGLYISVAGLFPMFVVVFLTSWAPLRHLLHVLSPHFGLGDAFLLLGVNYGLEKECAVVSDLCPRMNVTSAVHSACCGEQRGYRESMFAFEYPGIGAVLVAMFLHGLVMWLFVYLIESGRMAWLKYLLGTEQRTPAELIERNRNKENNDQFTTSEDVVSEQLAANRVSPHDVALLGRRLTKFYGDFLAVDAVSLHVSVQECFGLLGVNGAGKTSTFQMLTGESSITDGDAYIVGNSVNRDWLQAASNAGYCPQFDATMEELTVEQSLYMHCRLKGVPERQLRSFVDKLMRLVDIKEHAEKTTVKCSGGCKRRLSLAIALIGLPKVLLLDEPTAGVDPIARRVVWNVIAGLRRTGTAVVLTSHSMEECEALCTRLAIMVDGQFVCIGSTQHIKNQYGRGFTLMAKVATKADVAETTDAVLAMFPGTSVKAVYHTQLTFELPRSEETRWSETYANVERLARRLSLVDYSLSQTTLEQIFLQFSRGHKAKKHGESTTNGAAAYTSRDTTV